MPQHATRIYCRPLQRGIAALVAVLYLLFATGALTALAMQPRNHPGHGQTACTGDCRRDGCSLESQLKRTCCCWQKKQRHTSPPEPPAASGDCCHTMLTPEVVLAVLEDTLATQQGLCPPSAATQSSTAPVLTCSCPCNEGNQSALFISQINEILPFAFRAELMPPEASPFPATPDRTLELLPIKPPVPPPKPV